MAAVSRYVVYADFNCPFCHALYERLHLIDVLAEVQWRPVQHAPTASSQQRSYEALCELTAEVHEVRRRAPTTELVIPSFRPNTRLSTEVAIAADLLDPERARELRRLIYRAYWVEGRDISDPELLGRLLRAAGFPARSRLTPEASERTAQWQASWENAAAFDRSIPVTVPADGEPLVGFPAQPALDAWFLAERATPGPAADAVCAMKPPQSIAVLDRDAASIGMLLEQMRGYDVEVVAEIAELEPLCARSEPPDLLWLDTATLGPQWQSLVRALKASPRTRDLPTVLVGPTADPAAESDAFACGVADYLAKPLAPVVVKARLSTHLAMRSTHRRLRDLARLDSLTDTYNRREFDLSLQLEWDRAARGNYPLSVLMIDIDHFKSLNDRYGHAVGDDCLRAVARRLREAVRRPGDLLARYGGEEFAAILSNTDRAGATRVAERCRRRVEALRVEELVAANCPPITISVGTATAIPAAGTGPQSLVEAADRCLYAAKQAGRNRVVGRAGA